MMNMLLLWDSVNHVTGADQRLDLQIGGVILNGVLIDSVSSCNIIDQMTWEELKQKGVKCKKETTNQILYPYRTSEPLNTLGKFEASVNLDGKELQLNLLSIAMKAGQ